MDADFSIRPFFKITSDEDDFGLEEIIIKRERIRKELWENMFGRYVYSVNSEDTEMLIRDLDKIKNPQRLPESYPIDLMEKWIDDCQSQKNDHINQSILKLEKTAKDSTVKVTERIEVEKPKSPRECSEISDGLFTPKMEKTNSESIVPIKKDSICNQTQSFFSASRGWRKLYNPKESPIDINVFEEQKNRSINRQSYNVQRRRILQQTIEQIEKRKQKDELKIIKEETSNEINAKKEKTENVKSAKCDEIEVKTETTCDENKDQKKIESNAIKNCKITLNKLSSEEISKYKIGGNKQEEMLPEGLEKLSNKLIFCSSNSSDTTIDLMQCNSSARPSSASSITSIKLYLSDKSNDKSILNKHEKLVKNDEEQSEKNLVENEKITKTSFTNEEEKGKTELENMNNLTRYSFRLIPYSSSSESDSENVKEKTKKGRKLSVEAKSKDEIRLSDELSERRSMGNSQDSEDILKSRKSKVFNTTKSRQSKVAKLKREEISKKRKLNEEAKLKIQICSSDESSKKNWTANSSDSEDLFELRKSKVFNRTKCKKSDLQNVKAGKLRNNLMKKESMIDRTVHSQLLFVGLSASESDED